MVTPLVYPFDADVPEEQALELLGGKGIGLNGMTRMGIPVPPGFTITTVVCRAFLSDADALDQALRAAVDEALGAVERATGRAFGDPARPLLVSVRSGASVSMPGMMDTILNLGLTDDTMPGLVAISGDRRFALDAYRRLLQMYGDVVMSVPHSHFEACLSEIKARLGRPRMLDSELDEASLEQVVESYRHLLESRSGRRFPDDPKAQLWGAIAAVFRSWNNPRARRYRKMQGIPEHLGTACTVQAMVFGNLGEQSGSGVAFTRNPSTGERVLYGEYLPHAQGEDVVSGIRTPYALTADSSAPGKEHLSLERTMPEAFASIVGHCERLERHFRDLQDVEFTIEAGAPYILQTRSGKRTAQAGVRIAVSMVDEGLLSREEALLQLDAGSLDQLLHARLPLPEELAAQGIHPLALGLPASPGAATGRVVFHADDAVRWASEGHDVILVRRETSPEDIHGMKAAVGVLTATGGMTSHAAVVARGLGKSCVAGCSSLMVDYQSKRLVVRARQGEAVASVGEGDELTLDGSTGRVYAGVVEVVPAATVPEFETVMGWADSVRRLRVRANADTPRAVRVAARYGAEGLGLCRTEHMFFAEERLLAMRGLVLATEAAEQERFIEAIEPMQRADFLEIFRAMDDLPIAIRLLDWPLHEFMPRDEPDVVKLAEALRKDVTWVRRQVHAMTEVNPMLGHRGARVGLTRPLLYRAQVRAVLGAALEAEASGVRVQLEILIPFVSAAEEVAALRRLVEAEAAQMFSAAGRSIAYRLGAMIELPRACLVADELAMHADFFSFGTNDLTQTTFGISRDDGGTFITGYVQELGVFEADPFARLDRRGVGALIRMAAAAGRASTPDLGLGMCGEHGGEPDSIDFCEGVGLDYVSCSPPRIPIARLAAAQACLRRSGPRRP